MPEYVLLYKQFQDAYSSDSYEGSAWNEICEAVGLDLDTDGSNEDKMNKIEKVVQVEVIDTNKNDDEMSQETDGKGELRAKMKELRKILKTARKELCGDGDQDLHEMYKSYKQCTRSVKKQFKKLLGKDVTSENVPDIKTEETKDGTTSHKMTSEGEITLMYLYLYLVHLVSLLVEWSRVDKLDEENGAKMDCLLHLHSMAK